MTGWIMLGVLVAFFAAAALVQRRRHGRGRPWTHGGERDGTDTERQKYRDGYYG